MQPKSLFLTLTEGYEGVPDYQAVPFYLNIIFL